MPPEIHTLYWVARMSCVWMIEIEIWGKSIANHGCVCKTVCWWCEFSDIDSVLFPTYIECKTPIFLLHSYPNTLVFCDWVTLVFVLGHSTMPQLQRYIQNMNTTLCKTVHERSNIVICVWLNFKYAGSFEWNYYGYACLWLCVCGRCVRVCVRVCVYDTYALSFFLSFLFSPDSTLHISIHVRIHTSIFMYTDIALPHQGPWHAAPPRRDGGARGGGGCAVKGRRKGRRPK